MRKMRSYRLSLLLIFLYPALTCSVFAGGAAEESSERGEYVAAQGGIIRPDEIHIDSYIGTIDYRYPSPEGELGVSLYTGNRQVSMRGQDELIQIGLQGGRMEFDDLPPMNIAFVLDASGSMAAKDKMKWAVRGFEILTGKLRGNDTLSVVAFSDEATLLQPASRLREIDRDLLVARVRGIMPEGGSSSVDALRMGYEQVESAFVPGNVNRVLFVSDGVDQEEELVSLAEEYARRGISVTTIGAGMEFNLDLMSRVWKAGRGSTRFMSSEEKTGEIFGSDLDRMSVAVARNAEIDVELLNGVTFLETWWGYDYESTDTTVTLDLPTLHHRDYETILLHVRLPESRIMRTTPTARVIVRYEDRAGNPHTFGPLEVETEYAATSIAESGFSDPTVLWAGTILHFAQGLVDIGELYYSAVDDRARLQRNSVEFPIWDDRRTDHTTMFDELLDIELTELRMSIEARLQRCLDISLMLQQKIENAGLRLAHVDFSDQLLITSSYINTLSSQSELNFSNEAIEILLSKPVAAAGPADAEGLDEDLRGLVRELVLTLEDVDPGRIVFAGFGESSPAVLPLKLTLDELTESALSYIPEVSVTRSATISDYLRSLDLTSSDLLDTSLALDAGAEFDADYVITGSVMDMYNTVIVFARIINSKTETLESVSQIVIPKDEAYYRRYDKPRDDSQR